MKNLLYAYITYCLAVLATAGIFAIGVWLLTII